MFWGEACELLCGTRVRIRRYPYKANTRRAPVCRRESFHTYPKTKHFANLMAQVKNMIKSTSLSFGNAPTVYRSMATDQMDLKEPQAGDRGAQLEKNRLLKVPPVRHFSFFSFRFFVFSMDRIKLRGSGRFGSGKGDPARPVRVQNPPRPTRLYPTCEIQSFPRHEPRKALVFLPPP